MSTLLVSCIALLVTTNLFSSSVGEMDSGSKNGALAAKDGSQLENSLHNCRPPQKMEDP